MESSLQREGLNAGQKRDPQFLIEVLVKEAVMPGLSAKHGVIELHQAASCRVVSGLGLQQQFLKTHADHHLSASCAEHSAPGNTPPWRPDSSSPVSEPTLQVSSHRR